METVNSHVWGLKLNLQSNITGSHSFQFWLNELRRMRGDVAFVLVGCKADLRQHSNPYHVPKIEGITDSLLCLLHII